MSLKDDRDEFYDKVVSFIVQEKTHLRLRDLIKYLDGMRFSISIWEHPLMPAYMRYYISEEIRLKGSVVLTPQIELKIRVVLKALGYDIEVIEVGP